MLLASPRLAPEVDPHEALSSKVAWIDRYRERLVHLLPGMAPIDAALLAVEAHAMQRGCAVCPDDSATRYAAARETLFG
jgi:hypothetical protein